jgi:Glycogen debranching enzyme N terminal
VLGGRGAENIESFESSPWPKWIYTFTDGTRIQQEIFVADKAPVACVAWKLLSVGGPATLTVRPFLSGRDYHGLHRSNAAFRFGAGRVA